MSCVVKSCPNRSDRRKSYTGITFHRFSRENEAWRKDWVKIIRHCNGDHDWNPTKYSVICSVHFDANDIYTTKGGLRRVVTYAVPQKFLFDSVHMAEEKPVVEHNISSASQEDLSQTDPEDVKPCVSTLVLHQNLQSPVSNICNNFQKNISEHETKVFDHTDTSTFVLQEKHVVDNEITEFKTEITIVMEQPPNTSDNFPEVDNVIKEFKTEIVSQENEPEISDTSSNILENIPENETKIFDHTDASTFVLQEKQEVDDEITEFKTEITFLIEQPQNTSDNIQEDNDITEIGLREKEPDVSDTSSILEESTEIEEEELDPSKKYLKPLLAKKQNAIKKQRIRIKTLQQKVRRLQSRNKSLQAIYKAYKNKQLIPKPTTD